jgi:hypothetical protein
VQKKILEEEPRLLLFETYRKVAAAQLLAPIRRRISGLICNLWTHAFQ